MATFPASTPGWSKASMRWLQEHLRGGAGVVMDDVAAGALGAAALAVALAASGRMA